MHTTVSTNRLYACITLFLFSTMHRGRSANREVWVFGMCDISHRPSLGFMQVVQSRDANTLLPMIQAHIHLGTMIYSDCWRAYSNVQNFVVHVVQHHTVNHSLHFVDPAKGVYPKNRILLAKGEN